MNVISVHLIWNVCLFCCFYFFFSSEIWFCARWNVNYKSFRKRISIWWISALRHECDVDNHKLLNLIQHSQCQSIEKRSQLEFVYEIFKNSFSFRFAWISTKRNKIVFLFFWSGWYVCVCVWWCTNVLPKQLSLEPFALFPFLFFILFHFIYYYFHFLFSNFTYSVAQEGTCVSFHFIYIYDFSFLFFFSQCGIL